MEREKSEFNMAVSYLNRLNMLFLMADEAAMQYNMNEWYSALHTLFRELSTEMSDKELVLYDADFKAARDILNREAKKVMPHNIPSELYDSLHRIEIKLRRITKDAGLQQRMEEDDGL